MQGSHTHIPETNHVPRGYILAAILSLLFMVPLCLVPALVLLFFYVSTFRSMCAVPNMAVFCSSLTSYYYYYYYYYYIETIIINLIARIYFDFYVATFSYSYRQILTVLYLSFFNCRSYY